MTDEYERYAEKGIVFAEDREAERELQDLRDEVDALVAKLAEADERIEELEAACEVVSSEFEGELWVACRRILKKTGFDFRDHIDGGVQADAFEEHINDTLEAAETALATARRDALEEAANAMNPMLRSMISRGEAAAIIRALTTEGEDVEYVRADINAELLEALEEVRADCIARADKNGVVPIGRSAWMQLQTAIARAKGGTQ